MTSSIISTVSKKLIYTEVLIKNIVLILLFFVIILPQISYEFEILEKSQQGSVLSILGFLMAGGIIGAFELSYDKTDLQSTIQRYLAHLSKFLIYLASCILVWIGYKTMALTGGYYNDWILVAGILILASLFVFDFWDILSAANKQL